MIKLLADENFDNRILRGIKRKNASLDILRVQDTPMSGADDLSLLEWATEHERVLLTHDVNTITKYVTERLNAGLRVVGVLMVTDKSQMGQIIDDIILAAEIYELKDLEGLVVHIPL
jgi:hypothetical protein